GMRVLTNQFLHLVQVSVELRIVDTHPMRHCPVHCSQAYLVPLFIGYRLGDCYALSAYSAAYNLGRIDLPPHRARVDASESQFCSREVLAQKGRLMTAKFG